MSWMDLEDAALVAERNAKIAALGSCPPWWRPITRRRWKREHRRLSAMSVTMFAAFMRRQYPDDEIEELTIRKHPALSQLDRYRAPDGDR